MRSDRGFRSLERWTASAPAVGLLLVGLVALLYYRTTSEFLADARSVEEAHEVESRLGALLRSSIDVETAQRGYVLTGDPDFLGPLRAAEARIALEGETLRARIRDPEQRERLDALFELLRHRIGIAEETIAIREQAGFEAARRVIASGEGRRAQDQLRDAVARMEEREAVLLDEREARRDESLRLSLALLTIGFLLAVLAIAVSLGRVRRDLRFREEAEAGLREANRELDTARQRAEEADRVKSAFLAAMSHELRTPLNSIIGFTGILHQGLAGPLNPEQERQLGMVQASGRHLLGLINDVLDLSKLEARELAVQPEPFDVRRTLEALVASFAPQAERKGIALRSSLAPDLGVRVSDRRRFEQIVLNLVQNAIKFTEKGTVEVRAIGKDALLEVAITDTGIGIAPEEVERIFAPFHQVESGTARRHDGTGLGLAISRKLAALLGGEIRVESRKGEGSTFTFSLPAPKAERE